MVRTLLIPAAAALVCAGCAETIRMADGEPVEVRIAPAEGAPGTPTGYLYSTETPDRPGSWVVGEGPKLVPALSRRPGWDHNCAVFVNTAVLRRPDYFESPFKDIQTVGHGEPLFDDWRRNLAAEVYEPARWVVNLAASPVSWFVNPYWNRVLDYGPLPADRPAPPKEVVVTPRVVRVDE